MEITGMNDGNIYCVDDKKSYKVLLQNYEFPLVTQEIGGSCEPGELSTTLSTTGFNSKQWNEFFGCYLVAKTNQQAGKLHSIIESFGGSDQEVKARKSVAFQLLGLKSPK